MKKSKSFSLLGISLWAVTFVSQAQESLVFEEGKNAVKEYSFKEIKGAGKDVLLKSGSNEFTISKVNPSTIELESTSDQINLVNKEKKEYSFGPAKDTTCYVNNRIEICYDIWSKELKKRLICFRAFNIDGSIKVDSKEIFTIDCKGQFDNFNSDYTLSYSPDKSKIALIVEDEVKSAKGKSCTFFIFSTRDFTISNKTELPVEYNGVKTRTRIDAIDDAGNASIRFSTVKSDEKEGMGPSNAKAIQTYFGTLKAGAKSMTEIKEWSLDKTKERYSAIEERTSDDKLIQSGMYTAISGTDPISDGTFYTVTDLKTGKLIQETYNPFTANVFGKLNYKVTPPVGKKTFGYKDFNARQIVAFNGGYYLIAEHSIKVTSGNGGTTNCMMEILVSKYDDSGKNEWQVIVPKSTFPYLSGTFELVTGKDKLYLIYLEHPNNVGKYTLDKYEMDDYQRIVKPQDANVTCVSITDKGVTSQSILFSNKGAGFSFIPDNRNIKRDNKYLIIYHSPNERKYGTITVK